MKQINSVVVGLVVCAAFQASEVAVANPANASRSIALSCSGPAAMEARKIAAREKLAVGADPRACVALASMYGGSSKQLIVASPSTACAPKKAIQIYERANSGTWGNLLEKPVCGNNVSFGPNNPWGGIMITIDGKHFDQRGAYYTPANY